MGKSIIHISVWKGQTTHWLVTTKYWENSLFPVQIYSVSLYSTEISDFFLVHWWYLHAFSFNSCNPNRLARVSCCHFRHYSVNGKVPKCPWLSSASVDTLADDHSLYRPWPFFFVASMRSRPWIKAHKWKNSTKDVFGRESWELSLQTYKTKWLISTWLI